MEGEESRAREERVREERVREERVREERVREERAREEWHGDVRGALAHLIQSQPHCIFLHAVGWRPTNAIDPK